MHLLKVLFKKSLMKNANINSGKEADRKEYIKWPQFYVI